MDLSLYDVVKDPRNMAVVPCRVGHGRRRFAGGCAQGRRQRDGAKAAADEAHRRPEKEIRNASRELVFEPATAGGALGGDNQSW